MSKSHGYSGQILREAERLVTVDRKDAYGDAFDNFGAIAEMWTAYLRARGLLVPGQSLKRSDVPAMMDSLKLARHATGGFKGDNYTDKAGYSALLGAMVRIEKELETIGPGASPMAPRSDNST